MKQTASEIFNSLKTIISETEVLTYGNALRAMDEYANQSKWISVEETMPKINVIPGVLALSKNGEMNVISVFSDDYNNPIFPIGYNKGESYEVTHYQALPPLPEKP